MACGLLFTPINIQIYFTAQGWKKWKLICGDIIICKIGGISIKETIGGFF
jgi:hypothetical protein